MSNQKKEKKMDTTETDLNTLMGTTPILESPSIVPTDGELVGQVQLDDDFVDTSTANEIDPVVRSLAMYHSMARKYEAV